jgi:hypothetical protein
MSGLGHLTQGQFGEQKSTLGDLAIEGLGLRRIGWSIPPARTAMVPVSNAPWWAAASIPRARPEVMAQPIGLPWPENDKAV